MKSNAYVISMLLLCAAAACSGCKKPIKDDPVINRPVDEKNVTVKQEDDDVCKKKVNERFISNDTFRIVWLSSKDDGEADTDELKKMAEKKAETTLQNYLINEKKKAYDRNAKAEILKLIETGEFYKSSIECGKNNVYFFDIKKKSIQNHIDKIGTER